MNRFVNEMFSPVDGDVSTWQTTILKNAEIIAFTDKVRTQPSYSDGEEIKKKYGFNLYAIVKEDQYQEYLPIPVTVKICDCSYNTVPDDFDKDKLLFIIKDMFGNPKHFVYEDDRCEYWIEKRKKNKISNTMFSIF